MHLSMLTPYGSLDGKADRWWHCWMRSSFPKPTGRRATRRLTISEWVVRPPSYILGKRSARPTKVSPEQGRDVVFNVQFLHVVREFELARIASYLPPGARVLEIGGGSGYQALRLGQLGFEVCAVDVAGSTYAADMVFPVQIYDGKHLPFPDESFDVVFSSNVLEHIREPGEVHREA